MDNLIKAVEHWGDERELTGADGRPQQVLKLVEEVGELAKACLEGKTIEIKDAIGDCSVVLILLAKKFGWTFCECLEYAYGEIQDRQGVTENGVFKR